MMDCLFFFKQKTAYEMRISDWSSDVCSSDLGATQLIADKVDCPVLNAGDGQHEHPTQALLDALTLQDTLGCEDFTGLTVTICGAIGRASCRERVCQYV